MAATTEKYKGTKDGVEINVGGVTININFSTSIEEFNRIGNSTLEENNETKQDLIAVLNEDILTAYNTIINGSSSTSNSFVIKKNYSKKITDLYIKLKDEAAKQYKCTIKQSKNGEFELDSRGNIDFKYDEVVANNKETKEALKEYYSNFIENVLGGYNKCKAGFDAWLNNIYDWRCIANAKTMNDYLKKESYIQCGHCSGEWGDWNFQYIDYRNSTEYFPFGQHYILRNVGIVPNSNVISDWIKSANKTLKTYGFKIADKGASNIENSLNKAARGENTKLSDGDIIVSESEENKNPLTQIFDDCTASKGLGSAIKKHFGDFSYENKNVTNIGSVLNKNDYFKIGSLNGKNLHGIVTYICEAMKACFKGLKTAEANNAENIMNFLKKHASGRLDTLISTGGFTKFIDVDNYYDFYSSMAPRIKLTFVSSRGNVEIDNVNYSFIKSMKMTDNGAKKFEIVLYDRDFNTPIGDNGSLDKIIARTLNLNAELKNKVDSSSGSGLKKYKFGASNFGDLYSSSDSGLKKYKLGASNFGDLLGFKSDASTIGNLKIEYGFNDVNQSIKDNIQLYKKEGGYAKIGGTEYLIEAKEESQIRNARWWRVNSEYSNESNKTIIDRVKSQNPTTSVTSKIDTIITGYKTKFTEGGIYYTIEAIEFSENLLNNYKIYQRYTNIVGTPKEVLYSVIRIIESLFKKYIKIHLEDDLVEEGGIYEETEEVTEEGEEGEKTIGSKTKEISISLGSKDALSMYRDDDGGITTETSIITTKKAKMYKSVNSLLNDLCAVMPAKLDENISSEEITIEDEDGNSKKINEAYKTYRKFTYTTLKEDDGLIHIYFHYQKPRKFSRIRKYNWGPANSITSVIKSVDISTENEYSLLSSMTVINHDEAGNPNKKLITRDGGYFSDDGFTVPLGTKADYISSPGRGTEDEKNIAMSYAQCLYSGKITVLGDPFYNFDKYVTPYCYPIYIDFKIPMSEIEIKKRYSNNKDSFEANEEAINTTSTGYSHFMSGFYVITDIEQNISENGYLTTLGIMSYPNIAKDIGIAKY